MKNSKTVGLKSNKKTIHIKNKLDKKVIKPKKKIQEKTIKTNKEERYSRTYDSYESTR